MPLLQLKHLHHAMLPLAHAHNRYSAISVLALAKSLVLAKRPVTRLFAAVVRARLDRILANCRDGVRLHQCCARALALTAVHVCAHDEVGCHARRNGGDSAAVEWLATTTRARRKRRPAAISFPGFPVVFHDCLLWPACALTHRPPAALCQVVLANVSRLDLLFKSSISTE